MLILENNKIYKQTKKQQIYLLYFSNTPLREKEFSKGSPGYDCIKTVHPLTKTREY